MKDQKLRDVLNSSYQDNQPVDIAISQESTLQIYPMSINKVGEDFLFLARSGREKYLYVVSTDGRLSDKFEGKVESSSVAEKDYSVKRCPMHHRNADIVRELLTFSRPRLMGIDDSIGLGDRLGIANPGQLRSLEGSGMKVILAQQSIRELERTQREPEEVMDAATWAVFQEGYKRGFGADADHLKTPADIDRMVAAGFTMFTIDPGEFVVNEADQLALKELTEKVNDLPWTALSDDLEGFLKRYKDRTIRVSEDLLLQPGEEEVMRGLLKYGRVITHTCHMYGYVKETYPDHPAEFELSVDETDSVTSPFEHYLVANELKRLGVQLISLAPRFVGDFEKGIDYKGDLVTFKREYIKHVQISEALGPYKISIHSGSDKFKVYEVIGSLGLGSVHVKTAGTSYLEALRTVASQAPDLFREILDFARGLYESEKRTYHVSAQLDRVPAGGDLSDSELLVLFDQDDARQVLHVTFGKVLTSRDNQDHLLFRNRVMDCLQANESVHYDNLNKHFQRHLKPFLR